MDTRQKVAFLQENGISFAVAAPYFAAGVTDPEAILLMTNAGGIDTELARSINTGRLSLVA